MSEINMMKEVDALEEATRQIQKYEQKYGITTEKFLSGDCKAGIIDIEDECIWSFYAECREECERGSLRQRGTECEVFIESMNDAIFTADNNVLAVKYNDYKKGGDVKTSPSFYSGIQRILWILNSPQKSSRRMAGVTRTAVSPVHARTFSFSSRIPFSKAMTAALIHSGRPLEIVS